VAIEDVLKDDHEDVKITNSVIDVQFVPLGHQRLLTVELVYKMIQLNKEGLSTPIAASGISKKILLLVKAYPWNNFLQLKVMNLFTEVIENQTANENFRKNLLKNSGVGELLV
jgi:hypothetical protein